MTTEKYRAQAVELTNTAQQFLQKGQFIKAAALYNLSETINPGSLGAIEGALQDLEHKLLLSLDCWPRKAAFDSSKHQYDAGLRAKHRADLAAMRRSITLVILDPDTRSEDINIIYARIGSQLKSFLGGLAAECNETLGEAPCDFEIIGFGSLARGEATPYSDFEFAILTERDHPEIRQYFRSFTVYLHLKILNLGETSLYSLGGDPALAKYDTYIKKGISFDGVMPGACKTPLGNTHIEGLASEDKFELIGTPEQMASYVSADWFRRNSQLSTTISSFCSVYSNNDTNNLSQKYRDAISEMDFNERQERASKLLLHDLVRFTPNIGKDTTSGKIFPIKHELYRLFDRIFYDLALLRNLEISSTENIIESLRSSSFLSEEGVRNLTKCFRTISRLRLMNHLENGELNDEVLPPEEVIFEVYFTLLELQHTAQQYVLSHDQSVWSKSRFYSSTAYNKGKVYERLGKNEEALEQYKLAHKNGEALGDAKLTLVRRIHNLYSVLGKRADFPDLYKDLKTQNLTHYKCIARIETMISSEYKEAIEDLDTAERLYDGRADLPTELIEIEVLRGLAYLNREEFTKANDAFARAQKGIDSIGIKESSLLTDLYHNRALLYKKQGMYAQAIEYCEKAIRMDCRLYGDFSTNIAESMLELAGMLMLTGNKTEQDRVLEVLSTVSAIYEKHDTNNFRMGVVYKNFADTYLNSLNQPDLAIHYYKLSLEKQCAYYRLPSSEAASALCALAQGLYKRNKDGDLGQAQSHLNEAKKIYLACRKEVPDELQHFQANLSKKNKDFDKAIEAFKQLLAIDSISTPHKATILNDLGEVYYEYGYKTKDKKYYYNAIECYSQAAKINESSENKGKLPINLFNITITYFTIHDFAKTIEYGHRAKSIFDGLGQTTNRYYKNIEQIVRASSARLIHDVRQAPSTSDAAVSSVLTQAIENKILASLAQYKLKAGSTNVEVAIKGVREADVHSYCNKAKISRSDWYCDGSEASITLSGAVLERFRLLIESKMGL